MSASSVFACETCLHLGINGMNLFICHFWNWVCDCTVSFPLWENKPYIWNMPLVKNCCPLMIAPPFESCGDGSLSSFLNILFIIFFFSAKDSTISHTFIYNLSLWMYTRDRLPKSQYAPCYEWTRHLNSFNCGNKWNLYIGLFHSISDFVS